MRVWLLGILGAVTLALGCGDSEPAQVDVSLDASVDASVDAGLDVVDVGGPVDDVATLDVALDAGEDVGEETDAAGDTLDVLEDVGDTAEDDTAEDDAGVGDVGEDAAPEDVVLPPAYECGDEGLYLVYPIGDWRVCLAVVLNDSDPELAAEALALLESDLTKVEGFFEASIVERLQEVRIWLELDQPQFPGGVYHPNPVWLADNGYPEYWAEGVQIGNAANYLDWTNIQPAMVLHELSHAWHHQVVGYGQAEIKAAFEAAMAAGIYEDVAYAGGGTQKAYATTNHLEYFAELTEAFYWVNDFYPFNKEELEIYDPQGFQAVVNAWVPVN